jgi:hypothetical protein
MKKLFTLLTGTFLTASSFAQLIYKDDFAGQTSGALPSPPFTVINNDANTIDPFYTGQSLFADAWELRNFGDGIAAYSCAYFTATGTASDWMILGPLSLPTGSSPTLSFETYCDVSGTTYTEFMLLVLLPVQLLLFQIFLELHKKLQELLLTEVSNLLQL